MDNIYNVRSDSAKAVAGMGIARINLKYNSDDNKFDDFPITMREVLKLANDNIIFVTASPEKDVYLYYHIIDIFYGDDVWNIHTEDATFVANTLDDYPTVQII